MPRISTDNYDTVASWNGSQDLFVVEQPDGTKVATPAMVKQFVEAGDFEATGEVKDGHGNILKDMAKSADVSYKAGDVIVNENVIAAAIGSNANDCYFSIPISKPVIASSVSISNASCNVYYGTNQKAPASGATYTGTIKAGSILIKITKVNFFSQNGRYIVDFTGTFTFS